MVARRRVDRIHLPPRRQPRGLCHACRRFRPDASDGDARGRVLAGLVAGAIEGPAVLQRTVYSAIMAAAALLAIAGAFLPWAEREFVEVQQNDVFSVGETAPGVEEELGAVALAVG